MLQRNWTYAEITKQAEEDILRSVERAKREDNFGSIHWNLTIAYGILVAWKSLTNGYQRPGDSARLERLTRCN